MRTVPMDTTVEMSSELANHVVYCVPSSASKFSPLMVRNSTFDPVSVPPGLSDAETRYTNGNRHSRIATIATTCRQPTSRHHRMPVTGEYCSTDPLDLRAFFGVGSTVVVVITAPRVGACGGSRPRRWRRR